MRPVLSTEIDLSELKDIIEREPPPTSREVASKIGHSKSGIHYQFKQLRFLPKEGQ